MRTQAWRIMQSGHWSLVLDMKQNLNCKSSIKKGVKGKGCICLPMKIKRCLEIWIQEQELGQRLQRTKKQPKHFVDYKTELPPSLMQSQETTQSANSIEYPLSHFVSYERFSFSHKAFLVAITLHDEPKSFAQAMKYEHWREGMAREIKVLKDTGTWTLERLPQGKKELTQSGFSRLNTSQMGHFHETFPPVAKLVTVRCLLAVAAIRQWEIHQLDVSNAFLHGDLDEEVYMKFPQGFFRQGDTRVYRLQKSLYGLRQASRNWHHKFTTSLIYIGFCQSKADYSLFTYKNDEVFVAALIYVDDIVLTGNSRAKIEDVKRYLRVKFPIKDLRSLKYFLGIEVARSPPGIVISQRKYTLDIL